jgi:NADH dehydrogenase/NADH:ubiquinone oxidoreductase subunit G
MVTIYINGKAIQAGEDEMLLPVIRRQGVEIPALCHHDAIEPCGSCRLCMVEITKKEWEGWSKFVTSCLYPVEPNLMVTTHTPQLQELRKTILDLYLARSPRSEAIRKLASEYGIMETSYEVVPDSDDCIMCYACTRACTELGRYAISAVDRGHDKTISGPLREAPVDCIGCLSCAYICPTNFIKWEDNDGVRSIWGRDFALIRCRECGKKIITKDFADYLINKKGLPAEYFDVCDDCKRIETTKKMGSIVISAAEVSR